MSPFKVANLSVQVYVREVEPITFFFFFFFFFFFLRRFRHLFPVSAFLFR